MAPPTSSKTPRKNAVLPAELLFDEIFTRVPAAAIVRFRAVCQSWRAALTSPSFIDAHRAAKAAARQAPEIVFFAPAAATGATAFYTCTLPADGSRPPSDCAPAVRELATAQNLRGDRLLMPTKPCHGLTLLLDYRLSTSTQYYVCNLSTGEHVALPACTFATEARNSSAGLCFDAAAGEYKVVRLFEFEGSWSGDQICEVHTLGSGLGWRPCAGEVPAMRGLASHLEGQPPVLVKGSLYWPAHMARGALAPILSLSVESEQFGWVHMPAPQQLRGPVSHLAELDSSLCAVVDTRLSNGEYALWTWSGPGTPPSWSLRCRITMETLPRPVRDDLAGGWMRVVPLCSTTGAGGDKILLATSRHEVLAYYPGSNSAEKVLSVLDFVDGGVPHEAAMLLNIGLHEESVVGVGVGAGGGGPRLKMKLGSGGGTAVARRERPGRQGEEHASLNSMIQEVHHFLGDAMQQYFNARAVIYGVVHDKCFNLGKFL